MPIDISCGPIPPCLISFDMPANCLAPSPTVLPNMRKLSELVLSNSANSRCGIAALPAILVISNMLLPNVAPVLDSSLKRSTCPSNNPAN